MKVCCARYRYAEGAVTRLSGAKYRVVDVNVNVIAESSECWSREFVEDATWNVMESMVENVGRALGEEETRIVLSLYSGIEDEALAGIARGAVRRENWRPNVLFYMRHSCVSFCWMIGLLILVI